MLPYQGIIVEESLIDNRQLNDLKIVCVQITKEKDPSKRWHLYTVRVSKNQIAKLAKNIRPKWYMHFWQKREVIAIFKNKIFQFDYNKKETWEPVITYGLSIGIPKKQLDFPIE